MPGRVFFDDASPSTCSCRFVTTTTLVKTKVHNPTPSPNNVDPREGFLSEHHSLGGLGERESANLVLPGDVVVKEKVF